MKVNSVNVRKFMNYINSNKFPIETYKITVEVIASQLK